MKQDYLNVYLCCGRYITTTLKYKNLVVCPSCNKILTEVDKKERPIVIYQHN